MDLLEKIIGELLTEEVHQNNVSDAIKKRHQVSFIYDSGDGDKRGKQERVTVEPVAYGLTKAGNPCFRAYQTNGSSETYEKGEGVLPGWRLFLLDRVVANTWKDSGKIFNEPPMYNPNGDKTMEQVLVQADFKGTKQRYERGGLKKYNDARHAANVEKNPFYDFEKQARKKQMAPDFVMQNIKNTAKSAVERERQWNDANNERLKGNTSSINDMSKQKDFGNNIQQQTVGPARKGEKNKAIEPQQNQPNRYNRAAENGPKYKGQEINNEKNIENDEYQQRDSESTEIDA